MMAPNNPRNHYTGHNADHWHWQWCTKLKVSHLPDCHSQAHNEPEVVGDHSVHQGLCCKLPTTGHPRVGEAELHAREALPAKAGQDGSCPIGGQPRLQAPEGPKHVQALPANTGGSASATPR